MVVTNLAGSLQLEGDRLRTTGFSGLLNGGTIAIDSDLRLGGAPVVDGQVVARGRGLVMDAPLGLRSEMNADVTLRLTGKDLALSGNVDVVRASYREPFSLSSGLLLALQQPAPGPTAPPSRFEAMTLDVRVTTSEDVQVDNNYAQLALGANLALVGTLARPGMTGRATPREGGRIFLGGNVYRLAENGSIDFANTARIEPDLNVVALTHVRDYEVTLRVKGPPANVTTDLTSDPPLGQLDLVSLLVTGQTLAESPGGQPVVGGAGLLTVLSGELGAAGRTIGLDTLRVDRGVSPSVSVKPVAADRPGIAADVQQEVTRSSYLLSKSRESGGRRGSSATRPAGHRTEDGVAATPTGRLPARRLARRNSRATGPTSASALRIAVLHGRRGHGPSAASRRAHTLLWRSVRLLSLAG